MKKIGILSMQRIKNYGSFLQAYGLKNIIQELGGKVEFVDYHKEPPIIQMEENKNKFKKLVKVLKDNVPYKQKIQYILYKKNFAKKYNKILGLTKTENYNAVVDTLVIGSDEVFNCIQANENVGYSLELFGKGNRAKKVITYAASFGNTTIEKIDQFKKREELAELINKLDSISVRDDNSAKIIKDLTLRDVVISLDPVLIYDFEKNINLIPKLNIGEKYMIVYAYSGRISQEETKKIKVFAKKKGYKVYALGGAQKCADKFIDCSPFEVLAYFKNAECIVTDTFHGSIFSIINHKRFVTLIRKSQGYSYGNEEKLRYLLEKLNLSQQVIDNVDKLEEVINRNINYTETDEIIKLERGKTYNYLRDNI